MASTPSILINERESVESISNVAPLFELIVRSASKVVLMFFIRVSKPLKTDKRTIIAATGIAIDRMLSPDIILMTECDLLEKR